MDIIHETIHLRAVHASYVNYILIFKILVTHFFFFFLVVHWQWKEEMQKMNTVKRPWNSCFHITTSLPPQIQGTVLLSSRVDRCSYKTPSALMYFPTWLHPAPGGCNRSLSRTGDEGRGSFIASTPSWMQGSTQLLCQKL